MSGYRELIEQHIETYNADEALVVDNPQWEKIFRATTELTIALPHYTSIEAVHNGIIQLARSAFVMGVKYGMKRDEFPTFVVAETDDSKRDLTLDSK